MDPYVYPGTTTLRNLLGLRDPERLATFEKSSTAERILRLREQPLPGAFDAAHLKAIHHYLFQDVYSWAGQFRAIHLGKAPLEGEPPLWFTAPESLDREADQLGERLSRLNWLRDLPRADFARHVADVLADLNRLHPFREGNGRTQRQFLDLLARQAGHALHFEVVSAERMIQASIVALRGDRDLLIRLMEEITNL